MRRALQDEFEVEEATSRNEAIDLVRDVGSFDVAILDMRRWSGDLQPEPIDATEAIRALLKTEPGLGIVAHGDRAERHLASAALQAGAGAYVLKSAYTTDIAAVLRQASSGGDR